MGLKRFSPIASPWSAVYLNKAGALERVRRDVFPFFDSLPKLGVDGSLGFVTDFRSDRTLAGATGQVAAKTGTLMHGTNTGLMLNCQAFGYITTKSGKRLVYELVVNNVAITSLDDVLQAFQDEGRISAMLWHDN